MGMRTIRQGQIVMPFGVGAIIDIGQESYVMADISRWQPAHMRRIENSHLERKLHRPIKTPIAKEDVTPVSIHRFPRWHFCPRCRLMRMITGMEDAANNYQVPRCANSTCKGELTPMGFVAACKKGHLSEVDWHGWAHSAPGANGNPCSRQGAKLWFETTGQGGGDWSAISVRCGCGAKRNFNGLVQVEGSLGYSCRGGQPWVRDEPGCGEKLWVYRRAASNLHFPKHISALDLMPTEASISTDDLASQWEADVSWSIIKTMQAASIPTIQILNAAEPFAEKIATRNGCAIDQVMSALAAALSPREDVRDDAGDLTNTQAAIFRDEWETLAGHMDVSTEFLEIKRTPLPREWPHELLRTIRALSMVKRLREVRALLGFRRLKPDESQPLVPVDLGPNPSNWLPGVEAWGEGIFIQFDHAVVCEWESRVEASLTNRLKRIGVSASALGWDEGLATPRFLMLHSLAHAVIRRLSFDAGYAASSIRERIYSGPKGSTMCGILLYTADGDSEGSLGGLVRMGEPKRFGALLQAALLDIAWCSADPVCKESEKQGLNGMNAASCHACMLVSETSCSYNNSLLDRRTLVELGGFEPFFKLEKIAAMDS